MMHVSVGAPSLWRDGRGGTECLQINITCKSEINMLDIAAYVAIMKRMLISKIKRRRNEENCGEESRGVERRGEERSD